ncbi:TonB-dependent receptor [Mariniflexile sp.]|uniref:TonB-dependent receptor n=1 Tax=Mariniflexile sp. TaxID=1979402 RepID=UPI004048C948
MKNFLCLKICLVFGLLFPLAMVAQGTITGTITEAGTNAPLPGANIIVKGTANGAISDFDGKFSIHVIAFPVTVVVSSVGFNTKEVIVTSAVNIKIALQEGVSLDEVVLIGTRNPNRSSTDTAVPVDVIDVTELVTAGPQVNLNQILNYVAPSFTSNTQTISDGTDHIDPASLRGLGPDQVLVLINGKRRHNSSLVNVNGTFGRGSVGTDLNAIPAAAIQRIEVLRDGAAAQYGSDAIAGVINIVLKKNTNELNLNITTGANFTKNANDQTGGIDGETTNVSANYGLSLGEKGGFINFTGDFDVREPYGRMKAWEGSIFNLYNTVERFANNAGYDVSKLLDDDVADVNLYAGQAGIIPTGSNLTKPQLRTILGANNTPAELAARGLEASDFNMRVGQSGLRGGRFFANMSLPLDDHGTELYSFAGISSRAGNSAGFYRLPNQSRTYTPAYLNGFLPEINSDIKDKSFAVGIKGKISDWDVDFSNTWGKNAFLYTIGNTSNASMQNASPTTFDAGGFSFAQNTTNLDVSKFYDDVLAGTNVAFGAEYRVESYDIVAGEPASYGQYDGTGNINNSYDDIQRDASGNPILDGSGKTIPNSNSALLVTQDFFGASRPGGSQVFPGFSPANELSRGRSSVAGYLDIESDITESFLLSFATRYEDYSDFGSTLNFKLATRIKAGDNTNVRAAFNTGFRAPSLHQLNFNSTSTIFDNLGNPQEVGTFANDSRAAKLLGIPQLKQETSKSISVGFTTKMPEAHLAFTVDAYWVGIDDRVVYTGQFSPKRDAAGVPIDAANTELAKLLSQANASAASFFANAIDTESKGLDIVITHDARIGDSAKLKTDLSGTFSKTKKVGNIKASKVLEDAGQVETYFPEDSRVYLEEAVPRSKINLSNSLTTDKFNIFLRNVWFGKVTEATTTVANQQVFSSKLVTDLSFGYELSKSTTVTIGANNLFDIYPDRADAAFGNRSDGRFDWSRRAQQFGIGGRFMFARLSFKLK